MQRDKEAGKVRERQRVRECVCQFSEACVPSSCSCGAVCVCVCGSVYVCVCVW